MRLKRTVFLVLYLTGLLSGCGRQGPAGPAGSAGVGVQTSHYQTVSPQSSSGLEEIAAPEIVVNPSCDCSSTVVCYAVFSSSPGVENPIPMTNTEPDGTKTIYLVEVRSEKVTVSWHNSGSTIPNVVQFVVTVINR